MCMCHCKGKVVNDLPILGLLGDKKSSSGNVCPYISFSHVLGCVTASVGPPPTVRCPRDMTTYNKCIVLFNSEEIVYALKPGRQALWYP